MSSDPVNFISQSVNNAASDLIEILSMDVLCDLRKALSEQELKEFDAKYGKLIEKIRDAHDKRRDEMHAESEKRRKAAEEENKKREDEHKAEKERFANLMNMVDDTTDKINSVFDKIIDSGNQAKSELEQCLVLEDFYKYYDIADVNDPEIGMKFAKAIISKIESFECDQYDYFENVRSHFLKLLRTYPDKHVSTVSKVFTSLKNAQENSSSSENDQ